jgi:hypothetical protein
MMLHIIEIIRFYEYPNETLLINITIAAETLLHSILFFLVEKTTGESFYDSEKRVKSKRVCIGKRV